LGSFNQETPLSVSRAWVSNPANIQAVISTYKAEDKPTLQQVADRLRTPFHNISYVLRHHMPAEEFKAEKALRYSRSKLEHLNPMRGKSGSLHHNYKGGVSDGHGYLTEPDGSGGRIFLHRKVMQEALGLPSLPSEWHVHHIDGDPLNNSLDNLALVTPSAHAALHQKKPQWSRLPLWDQWESGISRSREIIPTPPAGS
jgi:hypothetical protein